MTVTYVAEAIQEVKRALIENQLGKVSEYTNSRTHRNAVYIVINQNFMIDKLAQIDNDEIREDLIGTIQKKEVKTNDHQTFSNRYGQSHTADHSHRKFVRYPGLIHHRSFGSSLGLYL